MALKQFLLNPDGSIPASANIAALLEAGVPLVLPTPCWRPAKGMMLEEREPQRDDQGVWRQVWVEVPVPPRPDVAIDEPV